LSKDFVKKIVFRLIQENVKVLSKGRGFANRYKFSHEIINFFPKYIKLAKKRKKVLPTCKSLAMKRWKFY
jgi:hypothetical protein